MRIIYLRNRERSLSSAISFSNFSGKCLLAHQTSPMTAKTTVTVINPSQNGSWSILSESGLNGMCIIRFSHRAPSHQAWQRHWKLSPRSIIKKKNTKVGRVTCTLFIRIINIYEPFSFQKFRSY